MQKILITGFGGFIGYSLVQLLKDKFKITALDNFSELSNYEIKKARAAQLGISDFNAFVSQGHLQTPIADFYYADLCNLNQLDTCFASQKFDAVIHLAALTGVRQSLLTPQAYIDSNVKGFVNLLECAHKHGVKNVIYASSSSVYGLNDETPYTEEQKTDSPISVYAASKKADELIAHTYAALYKINLIGLRFFTVYGPWTRPDMAAYIFMKAISEGKPIELFNEGKMIRDFTYVGDVINAISLLIEKIQQEEKGVNRIFNVGNHNPVYTIDFLNTIEDALGKKAVVNFKPIQPGDMLATNASCDNLYSYIGYKPETSIQQGVAEMVKWYKGFAALGS
ncbi:MAG TPA: NAD-dependent epimerase/dehydratase family protein [Chitinophagales bacterium]|nr:NAD-dependent epimerase/dehydratase family protein [Chitinophagales bacterium]